MNNLIQKKIMITAYFATLFTFVNAETMITISGQKVMGESETGKAIQFKLQEKQKDLATPLQAEEKKIQDLEKKLMSDKESLEKDFAELDKASKSLSAEVRDQKAEGLRDRAMKFEDTKREFDRLVQKLQAEARKVEAKMSELYQKEMTKLDSLVKDTIKDLAQKSNWDVVIMEESVVYANPKISKTNMVIEELDKKAKQLNQAKKQTLEKDMNKPEKAISKIENKVKEELANTL